MKTNKGNVIFCVGLITVLINAISSELLTSTDALQFTPDYEGNNGKLLMSNLINPDTLFKLLYYVEKSGEELIKIHFKTLSAARENSTLLFEVWRGIPGIEVFPREAGHPLAQYYFEGMYINLQPVSGTEHFLMKFRLKFVDLLHPKSIFVDMIMIAKPTTQESLRMAIDYDVYNCRNFKSFPELMTRMRSQEILVNLADDFPWIQDVLDRAKFLDVTANGDTIEWYYAGDIMVNQVIINGILRLDPLWEGHIRN